MANLFRPRAWTLPKKTLKNPKVSAVQKGAEEKYNNNKRNADETEKLVKER